MQLERLISNENSMVVSDPFPLFLHLEISSSVYGCMRRWVCLVMFWFPRKDNWAVLCMGILVLGYLRKLEPWPSEPRWHSYHCATESSKFLTATRTKGLVTSLPHCLSLWMKVDVPRYKSLHNVYNSPVSGRHAARQHNSECLQYQLFDKWWVSRWLSEAENPVQVSPSPTSSTSVIKQILSLSNSSKLFNVWSL